MTHVAILGAGPVGLEAALAAAERGLPFRSTRPPRPLRTPEPGFFIAGMKSYGRNNSFLVRVGWEQVDEIFSLIDIGAADVAANGAA